MCVLIKIFPLLQFLSKIDHEGISTSAPLLLDIQ